MSRSPPDGIGSAGFRNMHWTSAAPPGSCRLGRRRWRIADQSVNRKKIATD